MTDYSAASWEELLAAIRLGRETPSPESEGAGAELVSRLHRLAADLPHAQSPKVRDLSHEAVSRVYLHLVEHPEALSRRPERGPVTDGFVLTMLRWRLMDLLREAQPSEEARRAFAERLKDLSESSRTEDYLDIPALSDAVAARVRSLSEDDQRLLWHLLKGLQLKEIASREGVSYHAAAQRVHRLFTRLHSLHERSPSTAALDDPAFREAFLDALREKI